MGGGKGSKMPDVPAPTPPPKPEQEVTNAFRNARSKARVGATRSIGNSDITGGLLSQLVTGKKTLLGE